MRIKNITKILKTPQAEADLDEIWLYIAQDSLANADAFLDKLLKTIRLVAPNPFMGKDRKELEENLRSFPFEKYVVFYLPLADGIEIIRVLHGARDIEAIFH